MYVAERVYILCWWADILPHCWILNYPTYLRFLSEVSASMSDSEYYSPVIEYILQYYTHTYLSSLV